MWVLDENGGLIMQVRWAETAAPVTESDLERFRVESPARLSEGLPDEIRRGYLEVPYDVATISVYRVAESAGEPPRESRS